MTAMPVTQGLAWTAVAILPLWVGAFLFLTAVAGPGGPPPTPATLAEAIAQYADVSTAAWIGWLVFSGAVLALTSLTVLWLGRSVRDLPGGSVVAVLATGAGLLGLVDAVVTVYFSIGLKLADPPSYLPLVEELALGLHAVNRWTAMVVYGLLVVAVGGVAVVLGRARLLGRAARVLVVAAAVLLAAALVMPVPMLPAVLTTLFGIVVLRCLPSTRA
ncbi:hypothetical protein GCM10009790_20910 [Georgenia ruanii]